MSQLVHFDIELTAVDHPTGRRRWNGDPMASEDASRALNAAVDAARVVVQALGFELVRTGYGVRASDLPDAA